MSTLLLVHAHPDDEAIATGGVMVRAHRDGHRVVLVTCTNGEEGEIYTLDEAETRPRLGEIRAEELRKAGEVLGVDRIAFLGYRDSGMAGLPSNDREGTFHRAPLSETASRLAAVVREERPDAVVTYTADGTYGHPDHVKAHRTTLAALDVLQGEGWSPGALYLHAIPISSVRAMEERARAAGAPIEEDMRLVGVPDAEVTTRAHVRDLVAEKMRALECHVSQLDPDGPWRTMAAQIAEAALGTEHFVLARGDGARGDVPGLLPGSSGPVP